MSRMYDIIQELCRRDGTDVTKMCRALKIPRSTLSELASGRTKQLTLKHARPIAEYFGVTIAQLAGDEPLETEPDQTDAVSDLIRDEPIAAYENLKRYLTEEDKADIATQPHWTRWTGKALPWRNARCAVCAAFLCRTGALWASTPRGLILPPRCAPP